MMKNNTRRVISSLLIAALFAAAFAGCSNDSGKSSVPASSTASAPSSSASESEKEKPTKISYVSWSCGEYEGDTWIEQYIEEKLNIELEVLKVDLSNAEAKNLMLASDEFPDCGWVLTNAQEMNSNGLIRTIPEDMIRTYAPNYSKALDATPNGWSLNLDDNGEHLSLIGIILGQSAAANGEMFRLDWLKKIGIMPDLCRLRPLYKRAVPRNHGKVHHGRSGRKR